MDSSLKISIIIPLYNVEDYIEKCLQSVVNQTYTGSIECLIVDDCGTDRSVQIVENFISNYDGTVAFSLLHHNQNRGQSAARNTGLQAATGDYILFLDSDDWLEKICLDVLTTPLKDKMHDIIIANHRCWPLENFYPIHFDHVFESSTCEEALEFKLKTLFVNTPWNKLMNRSVLQKNNISFDETMHHEEDEKFVYDVICNTSSMLVLTETTYVYRCRENSISMNSTSRMEEKIMSYCHIVKYMARNTWNMNNKVNSDCVLYYFKTFVLTPAFENGINIRKEYIQIRNLMTYNPLKLFLRRKCSLRMLKRQLHYALPPILGYYYLCLRDWKNKLNQ